MRCTLNIIKYKIVTIYYKKQHKTIIYEYNIYFRTHNREHVTLYLDCLRSVSALLSIAHEPKLNVIIPYTVCGEGSHLTELFGIRLLAEETHMF